MKIDSFRGEYRFLSNFHPCEVFLDGIPYRSVEHAYQAAKSYDPEYRRNIRSLVKPGDAKKAGQRVDLRKDWEEIKLNVMKELLQQKFAEGTDLAEKLLATGGAELEEGNTWNDFWWGVCNGKGQNWLGKLLMECRDELKENADLESESSR